MAFEVEGNSFQVYLTSDGCADLFPDNLPNNFKIALKNRKEFHGKNQKYSVNLSRFGFDSAMYNLGDNTATYFSALIKGKFYLFETKNEFVPDASSAVIALNQIIESFPESDGTLQNHIKFRVHENKVGIQLFGVEDFGMSPMLRKLLGYHRNVKLYSESFDFRKAARIFLEEIADTENFANNLAMIKRAYSALSFKSSKFPARNDFLKAFGLNVENFYQKQREDLVAALQDIMKGQKKVYDDFLAKSYYQTESVFIPYSFSIQDPDSSLPRSVIIPASTWTMIDFLVHSITQKSFQVGAQGTFLTPDVGFCPNLFNCLYIYTNLIKPVAFNDGEYKLLDMVFLKRAPEFQNQVIEFQSSNYKLLEVQTINEIQILITTSLGTPAPFIHGPVFVVLEFQRI